MKEEDRWSFISALDEELLRGGVLLSEWCIFIIKEADVAFVGGANLAAILTSVSGIETYLRSEYSETRKERLVELINGAPISNDLKTDLHALRKYRNKWVHVDAPEDDTALLEAPDEMEAELGAMAFFACVYSVRPSIKLSGCDVGAAAGLELTSDSSHLP